jgi:chromosome segregation ATPase
MALMIMGSANAQSLRYPNFRKTLPLQHSQTLDQENTRIADQNTLQNVQVSPTSVSSKEVHQGAFGDDASDFSHSQKIKDDGAQIQESSSVLSNVEKLKEELQEKQAFLDSLKGAYALLETRFQSNLEKVKSKSQQLAKDKSELEKEKEVLEKKAQDAEKQLNTAAQEKKTLTAEKTRLGHLVSKAGTKYNEFRKLRSDLSNLKMDKMTPDEAIAFLNGLHKSMKEKEDKRTATGQAIAAGKSALLMKKEFVEDQNNQMMFKPDFKAEVQNAQLKAGDLFPDSGYDTEADAKEIAEYVKIEDGFKMPANPSDASNVLQGILKKVEKLKKEDKLDTVATQTYQQFINKLKDQDAYKQALSESGGIVSTLIRQINDELSSDQDGASEKSDQDKKDR